jgi:hypothetical protein
MNLQQPNKGTLEDWQLAEGYRLLFSSLLFVFIIISCAFYYIIGAFSLISTLLISVIAFLFFKDMIVLYIAYGNGVIKKFQITDIKHSENSIQTRKEIMGYVQSSVDAVREDIFQRTVLDHIGYNRAFHLKSDSTKKFTVTINIRDRSIDILLSAKAKGMETDFDSLFDHNRKPDSQTFFRVSG